MATLNLVISTGNNDGEQATNGGIGLSASTIRLSTGEWAGFYFPAVAIPAGATIDSAVLSFYLINPSIDDVNVRIKADDADDAAALSTTSSDFSNRTLTTASVTWNETDAAGGAAGYQESPDIKAVIQEVVGRAGWASGNDLMLACEALGGDFQMRAYDGNAAQAAKLDITYTEGGTAHNLTAVGVTTGSPTVGEPALGQVHGLGATGAAAGSPTLGAPAVGQTHALTAAGVAAGAPVLGAPSMEQVHALAAGGLDTAAPTVGAPVVGQAHALSADGPAIGAPVLASPALGQLHVLASAALVAGAPTLGTPALGTDTTHALEAEELATGSPTVGAPVIGQVHVLVALGLTTGAPVLPLVVLIGAAVVGRPRTVVVGGRSRTARASGGRRTIVPARRRQS